MTTEYNTLEEIDKKTNNSIWIMVVGLIFSIILTIFNKETLAVIFMGICTILSVIDLRYWNLKKYILYGVKR